MYEVLKYDDKIPLWGIRLRLFYLTHLENDLVWVDAIGQAESIAEVSLQLRDLADKGKEL